MNECGGWGGRRDVAVVLLCHGLNVSWICISKEKPRGSHPATLSSKERERSSATDSTDGSTTGNAVSKIRQQNPRITFLLCQNPCIQFV